jgi:hypothetical protein
MESLLSELLVAHILPRMNTRYIAMHLIFINRHYYSVCKDYLQDKEISDRQEYVIWLISFLDVLEHVDIFISDITEENVVASGNIKHIRASDHTCPYSAIHGNLKVLKWARENGCEWNSWTCAYAARNGHLHVLKWARENGCPWDSHTCARAALNGHLEILKWARENGCEWNSWTCENAALNGHLHVLKWAIENGCDWGLNLCRYAATGKQIHLIRWLKENGYICVSNTCDECRI